MLLLRSEETSDQDLWLVFLLWQTLALDANSILTLEAIVRPRANGVCDAADADPRAT